MHKSKLSQNFYTIGRNNELKSTCIGFSQRKEKSKSLPYGTYTDYFQYTSDKDGMIYVNAEIKLETLSSLNGVALMQIYSNDGDHSYINNVCTANPYTNGFGGISLHLDYVFYAKAGVTYKVRGFQATSTSAAYNLTMSLFSNVTWEEI